ncbi:tyrosine-type recombinase/integrase [Chloroflexota bacterium]
MSRRSAGEGSIFKNNRGYWVAQITLPDGRRKQKSSKKQKVSRDWLLAQRDAIRDGVWIGDESLVVSTFFDRYLNEVVVHRVRPKTYERYEQFVRLHIKPGIGRIRIAKLRPDHLQSLYSKKLGEGLSKRSVQQMHAVIHKALNQAMKWGLVARNVSDLVEPPKPQKRMPITLNPDQVNELFTALEDDRLSPLYVTAIATGMRQGELLGLMWEDVDLDNGVIHVKRTAQTIWKKGTVISDTKTDRSRRSIPLPQFAVEALKNKPRTSDFVFPSTVGTPIPARNLLRHWHNTREKIDQPDMRFHDLRHTSATLLLQAGVHPKVVQERLGHSRISMTLDTYSHVVPSMQEEAANQLQAILK